MTHTRAPELTSAVLCASPADAVHRRSERGGPAADRGGQVAPPGGGERTEHPEGGEAHVQRRRTVTQGDGLQSPLIQSPPPSPPSPPSPLPSVCPSLLPPTRLPPACPHSRLSDNEG